MDSTYFETYQKALNDCTNLEGVLGEECVIHPPDPDFGYDSTPKNALTFGCMGVDGVHYAILTIDGSVSDESPVIQICPMDFSDLYQVIGGTFLSFLADACGVSQKALEEILATERAGKPVLIAFLKENFDMSRLWDDDRTQNLTPYLKYIEPNVR